MHLDPRKALSSAKRLVVKIGSRSIIAGPNGRFGVISGQVAELRDAGVEGVVVSSGAIALGLPRLGLKTRPRSMPKLQAAAATGQSRLMHAWEEAFAEYQIEVAQILVTHAGLSDREGYLNARAALEALLEHRCVPIINENDSVAVDEIRFGDNDQLAAMVAALVGADVLVLLTDVAGLLDANDQRVPLVRDAAAAQQLARPTTSLVSMGGMTSKLEAARRACLRGVPVVIADARESDILPQIFAGEDVGTLVLPDGSPLASRKHWIAYTLKPRGRLHLDPGAEEALRTTGCSLLPAGVLEVDGEFFVGDSVSIITPQGQEMARGLVRYDASDVRRVAGARANQIEGLLGYHSGDVIVHRDDLVLL